MRSIRLIIICFCFVAMVMSCTQYNYRLHVVKLANDKGLLVKFNNNTGMTWITKGSKWNLIVESDQLPISEYDVWVSKGIESSTIGVYRIDKKTGQTWRYHKMKWIGFE